VKKRRRRERILLFCEGKRKAEVIFGEELRATMPDEVSELYRHPLQQYLR